MGFFRYIDGRLHAEDVPVAEIVAQYGSPCYVYSRAALEAAWLAYDDAFGEHPHLICYAVKANSNIAVLNLLARLGSGFDIVSVGELERVLCAGGDPGRVVFAGVGKRADEMRRALEVGIRCFNVESRAELQRLNQVASGLGLRAPVSLRVNPDVDANTHPYISTGLRQNKFGIAMETALDSYREAASMPGIELLGIGCHIGSQLTELAPFVDALRRILGLLDQLQAEGISLSQVDIGGGLGIHYRDETPPAAGDYVQSLLQEMRGRTQGMVIEPGRSIAGNSGMLVTRVEYLKPGEEKHFAIVDAAMNDLIRPALYSAWQDIIPVDGHGHGDPAVYDVVGPVCESADFLGKDRELDIAPGDLLAVLSAGAYGFTMSSTYNSRPRVAELMVDGSQCHCIRAREGLEALMAGERLLPAG